MYAKFGQQINWSDLQKNEEHKLINFLLNRINALHYTLFACTVNYYSVIQHPRCAISRKRRDNNKLYEPSRWRPLPVNTSTPACIRDRSDIHADFCNPQAVGPLAWIHSKFSCSKIYIPILSLLVALSVTVIPVLHVCLAWLMLCLLCFRLIKHCLQFIETHI